MTRDKILLGLIGDNIGASQAPRLHRLAGAQSNQVVEYNRLVPADLGLSFDNVFDSLTANGYRGSNITYPYKERAVQKVKIDDPLVRSIGAINTVILNNGDLRGYNTDYSGFITAFQRVRGKILPGITLVIGTGGVGRAIAFALIALGATELRLVDRDLLKANALLQDLRIAAPALKVEIFTDTAKAAHSVTGVVNCTPVGMAGNGGTPLPAQAFIDAAWAFDAVYTPVDTEFLTDAAATGLTIISGWELFFYQGVHAWKLFSGESLNEPRLRLDLLY